MRLTSLLVLGLAALTAPADALRTSASSTLARLSQRLAAAESALAELKSQSQIQLQPYPTPNSQYTFDSNNFVDKYNSNNKGTPTANAGNIGITYDSARAGPVMVRSPSTKWATSTLTLPNQLSSSFTLGLWVNWNGVSTGGDMHVLDSSDGMLQMYLDASGSYNVMVNGIKQTDPKAVVALTWRFYAITVGNGKFSFYRADKDGGNVMIGQVAATYPGTATSLKIGNSALSPSATASWTGYIDSISIYNYALDDSTEADLWWGTNNGATPTGQAPVVPSYYGHFSVSQIVFSNRYAGQFAGDWSISIALDADVLPGDAIYVRFNGCTGVDGSVTFDDGTVITYTAYTGTLAIKPGKVIPQGTTQTYNILGSQIQVKNPTTLYASPSDPNWKIGILWSGAGHDFTQTGIRYEGAKQTPATLNPNPTML